MRKTWWKTSPIRTSPFFALVNMKFQMKTLRNSFNVLWLFTVSCKFHLLHNIALRTPSNQSYVREAEWIYSQMCFISFQTFSAQILQSHKFLQAHSLNASFFCYCSSAEYSYFLVCLWRDMASQCEGITGKNHFIWWLKICCRFLLSEIHLAFYAYKVNCIFSLTTFRCGSEYIKASIVLSMNERRFWNSSCYEFQIIL